MAYPFYAFDPQQCYAQYPQADRNGVKTLFIAGLPDDIKSREIHNLFCRRPGFDFCQLEYTGRGNQAVAFATFVNHQSAIAALHSLNGAKFDPETGATLHIELAKSNSRKKHMPGGGPYTVIDRRNKASRHTQETVNDFGYSDEAEAYEDGDRNITDQKNGSCGDVDTNAEGQNTEKSTEGGSPCSTLFISNLGPACTEDELKGVVAKFSGFTELKMSNRGKLPVAFVDFEGIEEAMEAMKALQDMTLPSSDRGAMRVEYARSKMRKT